jgi:hypothetical protein
MHVWDSQATWLLTNTGQRKIARPVGRLVANNSEVLFVAILERRWHRLIATPVGGPRSATAKTHTGLTWVAWEG